MDLSYPGPLVAYPSLAKVRLVSLFCFQVMAPLHSYSFQWASIHSPNDVIPTTYCTITNRVEPVNFHGFPAIRLHYCEQRTLFQCPLCTLQVKCCPGCYATFCLLVHKETHRPACSNIFDEQRFATKRRIGPEYDLEGAYLHVHDDILFYLQF